MKRGEVWWAHIDGPQPVVLLSDEPDPDIGALQIVAPATAQEKRGFLILSGSEAADPIEMRRLVASAGPDTRAVGIEVGIGADEGLPFAGVIRLAFPRDGHIFCTWQVTLSPRYLIERAGTLSAAKIGELDNALRLSATA